MAIEKRVFGRSGHMSSAIVFGAAALARADESTADRVLDLLLEYDVNHIDTAARYGDSELLVGRWMLRHRDRFFLATKTGDRDYAGARDAFGPDQIAHPTRRRNRQAAERRLHLGQGHPGIDQCPQYHVPRGTGETVEIEHRHNLTILPCVAAPSWRRRCARVQMAGLEQ